MKNIVFGILVISGTNTGKVVGVGLEDGCRFSSLCWRDVQEVERECGKFNIELFT